MLKYLFKGLWVVLISGLFLGCEIINPEEDQPAFIHIERPKFDAGADFGSDSHEILSGWVYYNGRLLGVFDFPADLPVLHSGETRIAIEPGVISDGQRATRTNYPFYTRFTDTLNLVPGQRYTITPEFTFRPLNSVVQQPIYEDFEDNSGTNFSVNAPYTLQKKANNPADAFYFAEGDNYFGFVQSLTDTTTEIRIESNIPDLQLIQGGRPVYAEFNIRNSRQVEVGVTVTRNGQYEGIKSELVILPSNTWKKFYVNLLNEVNNGYQFGTNPTFNLIFLSRPTESGEDYIAVDNIRIIQFP